MPANTGVGSLCVLMCCADDMLHQHTKSVRHAMLLAHTYCNSVRLSR